ncbi:MAG: regulatory iron-sulfur-containing complex subunit RicT [bacterium]|nr:regulatory iron-sulfur-containing complex subunit RicT [bacterium]
MLDILEMEFKGRRKEYFSNPLRFPFDVGDPAVVEAERGFDLGRVSHLGWHPGMEAADPPPHAVVRRATAADLRAQQQNTEKEDSTRRIAREKILAHQLEMKLVDVEFQWDGRKMTFYFTAEGRVDFRELVKDLASTFRTRIDLRQIGARDETKRTGGYGVCGRPLCCATFLTEFKPITTQMPRDQFLPLNPSKLSGVCGRLKCCLRYELDVYREFQRQCPKTGHPVKDEAKGEGAIEKLDVIRRQVNVRYQTGALEKLSHQEFLEISNWRPEMPRTECICTCGPRTAAAPPPEPPERDEEELPAQSRTGEKVTLLAGGGLGMQSGGAEIQVGADLSVPAPTAKKKRKRHRSHKKKPPAGASGPDGASPDKK